jgi:ring hydroxylating enzyme beta subunit
MARQTAYYAARARPAGCYRRLDDEMVLQQIRAVTNSRATYGYRRVWAMVNRTFRAGYRNGEIEVRSRFHMLELRRDDVRHFAGAYSHRLVKVKNQFKIKLQRVDMANAQAAYDYVLQVWV